MLPLSKILHPPVRCLRRQSHRPLLERMEDRLLLATYDVTSTADDGSPHTLRWAITSANNQIPADQTEPTITFHIGMVGPDQKRTIQIMSPLPHIKRAMSINALTQGGQPEIGTAIVSLDGRSAEPGTDGLTLDNTDHGVQVQGLLIHGFLGYGVSINGSGNYRDDHAFRDNIFDGNGKGGVYLKNTTGVEISYNGINNNGTLGTPDVGDGVFIDGGGSNDIFHNNIDGNEMDGVRISGNSDSNFITDNHILGNFRYGIEIATGNRNGISQAPVPDSKPAFANISRNSSGGIFLGDSGLANNGQKPPVLSIPCATSTTLAGDYNVTVEGDLANPEPDRSPYTVELFANTPTNAPGGIQGERYLDSVIVRVNSSNPAGFFANDVVVPKGMKSITATVRDSEGNTSSFSKNREVSLPDLSVSVSAPSTTVEGSSMTYQFTITNPTSCPVTGVKLMDTLPPQVRYQRTDVSADSAGLVQYSQSGGIFTATIGDPSGTTTVLIPNRTVTFSITVFISEEGDITNQTVVTSDNAPTKNISTHTHINDAPLHATPRADLGSLQEGIPFNDVVATFRDDNTGAPLSDFQHPNAVTIDWGDKTPLDTTSGYVTAGYPSGTFVVHGSHVFDESPIDPATGQRTASPVTVTITDIGGATATTSFKALVTDAPLHITSLNKLTGAVEGVPLDVPNLATFTDDNPMGTPSDFTATITWGDGTSSTVTSADGGIVPNGQGGFLVKASHVYLEEGLALPFSVTVRDQGGASDTRSDAGPIAVADAPLHLTSLNKPTGAVEGVPLDLPDLTTFTDDDPMGTASDYTATITWGDGTTSTVTSADGGIIPNGLGGFLVKVSHVYREEGQALPFSVTVRDQGGASDTRSDAGPIAIADAPLHITSLNKPTGAVEGVPLDVANLATFTDDDPMGTASDYTATITWGDGTTSTLTSADGGIIPNGLGGFLVKASHVYLEEGQALPFSVTVRDQGGASAARSDTVKVGVPSVVMVTLLGDDLGPDGKPVEGTFRDAIEDVNAADPTQGPVTIAFDRTRLGPGPYTITLKSALESIRHPVVIDAMGPDGRPTFVLDGDAIPSSGGPSRNGLELMGGSSLVQGLVIINFRSGTAIAIQGPGNNRIRDNVLGIGLDDVAYPNQVGVLIVDSANNAIGGTSPLTSDPNSGTFDGVRNFISGNTEVGVFIYGSSNPGATSGNAVQDNFIGTDLTGLAMGNGRDGVLIDNASNNLIGNSELEANVISGNGNRQRGAQAVGNGVEIAGAASTGNKILSNYIGTDLDEVGMKQIANTVYGVVIQDAKGNIIGTPIVATSSSTMGSAASRVSKATGPPRRTTRCRPSAPATGA